jgi:beta-N-acetylhexosaminidase
MLDVGGLVLTAEDRELLRHPAVGGVILFARNYRDPDQLAALVQEIRALRTPHLLIAVDQEGGRVQRFREGFVELPPAAVYQSQYSRDKAAGQRLAEHAGWLMAAELRSLGVDFSFAPVVDLDYRRSKVIGDRSFGADPVMVAQLAQSWCRGVRAAGMSAVAKHFPGHGFVEADSHLALPVDERELHLIEERDLYPFRYLVDNGLEAIMPAHVLYAASDEKPAGFSTFWLQHVLRERLKFQGVIFSDDLSMAGAEIAGDFSVRARAALTAGCDMVLVCNDRAAAIRVAEGLVDFHDPVAQLRMLRMHGRKAPDRAHLHADPRWRETLQALAPWRAGNSGKGMFA